MKKISLISLMLVILILLSACNTSQPATPQPPASQPSAEQPAAAGPTDPAGSESLHIGLAMNALDEFQSEWLGYFQSYIEGLGHTLTVTNAEGKVDKQLADVETLIQLRPDVIAVKAVDPDGVIPCFEAIEGAGIPGVAIDMQANTDIPLRLSSDQREHGVSIGNFANQWLLDNPDETIRAGYIIGVDVPSVIGRRDGWLETMDEAGNNDRWELLTQKICNWSATEAMAAAEDWIQAYPQLNWIVAMSDEMAIAAVNVVEAAGKTGEIIVVGVDGSPNAQVHIRDGSLAGSSFIPRRALAEAAADWTLRAANENLGGQHVDIGQGRFFFLTIDNIDEVLARF